MKLDFFPGGSWQEFNEHMTENLIGVAANYHVKTYLGLQHGLIEITQGLIKLFPHKNKVYFFKDLDPTFELPMKQLAKEGHDVIPLELDVFNNPEKFVENLEREALLLLYPKDDPFLGKCFLANELVNALNHKRVFSIGVSHSGHRMNGVPKEINKFEIHLNSISSSACIAYLGDRAKIGDIVSEALYWNEELAKDFNEYVGQLNHYNSDNYREAIEEFESMLGHDAKLVFEKSAPRVCDRAVFYWEDLDGFAFVNSLAQELNLTLGPPGQDPLFETTSLIRWGGVKTMDWLKKYGLSENQIRGLVIIDQSLLSEELIEKIGKVRQKIMKLQFGA